MVVVAVCEVLKKVCDEHELDVYSVCDKFLGVRISINSNGSIKIHGMCDDGLAGVNGVESNARIVRDIPASVSEDKKVKAAEREAAKVAKAAEREAAKAAKAAKREAAKAAKAKKASSRICGKCGGFGHNWRTYPVTYVTT